MRAGSRPTRRRPPRCSRPRGGASDEWTSWSTTPPTGRLAASSGSTRPSWIATSRSTPGPRCSCVPSSPVTRSPARRAGSSTSPSGQGLGPMPGELAYAVTKAALDVLTVSLSAELADRHITVNAVDPGPTDTGWMTASVKAALEAASPTGTVASPQDTARVVRALVSDAAAHVTGQIVRVRPGATDSACRSICRSTGNADRWPASSARPGSRRAAATACR